jgi:DNA-binding SARP family transcriptional activator
VPDGHGAETVELRALGPVEAVVGGRLVDLGPPKQRLLFALLLSRVDRPVAVDTLIEALWSGDPPAAATASLQAYVSNLRRVLEPRRAPRAPAAVLRTRAPGYLLDSRGGEFDVRRFTGHVTAGWAALGRSDSHHALSEFDAALALWRGEAYADAHDAVWAAPEVARLEEQRLSVIEGRSAALVELGAHEVVVAELDAHVRLNPLREHGCRLLALALYRCGRQADALAVLRAIRARLAEELGIDPGSALQGLERDILAQAPALDWSPATSTASVTTATPTPATPPVPQNILSQPVDGEVFVGREAALRSLCEAAGSAAGGRGRVVLVAGEPGIGKTALLRRFADLATVPVVWGGCPEHVAAPPLWPWEQVLRAVAVRWPDRRVPDPVAALLDGQSPQVAGIHDVTGVALRRFEAIWAYLVGEPDGPPLVVVLDDLHWADIASLRLLAHLAEPVAASRLLLIASYRPHESDALGATLAALAGAGSGRIELTGLGAEDAHALVRAVAGREVSATAAGMLRARTEGNPFFLGELVRLLNSEHRLEEPGAAPVPPKVRDVVLRRVARLPEPAAALLSVAAVAGREFDAQVVAEAASVEAEAALESIDAGVAAGLVVESEQRLGWFGFTHALVAESLYETTGRLRRARRHRRIGEAAARAWAGRDEGAGEIARHWLLAAELDRGTAARASAHAAAAARIADARLAPENAAELWRHALAAAERAGDVDRYPLLVGLATSLYRAGHLRDGLPLFVEAMEQALGDGGRGVADTDRLVAAAVAATGESAWYPIDYGEVDDRLVGVLERGLAGLSEPVQRALVLSCLAQARYYDGNAQRRAALCDQALDLARPTADSVALAHVLRLRAMALYGPDYPEQCCDAMTESLGLTGLLPPLMGATQLFHADLLFTLGRVKEATAELDLVAPLVQRLRAPPLQAQLDWARVCLLLLAGRWQEAEALSRTAYSRHSGMNWGLRQGTAVVCRTTHRWEAAFLTGTGADLVGELRDVAEATGLPTLYNLLAMALVEAGRPADARAALRPLATSPRDYLWLYTQCWGLLAAARLGEAELVARLRAQLMPYRRLACAACLVVVSGSVAYFTAEAALALGDPDAALVDLATATEADEEMGALPWLARARDAMSRAQRLRQAGTKPAPSTTTDSGRT